MDELAGWTVESDQVLTFEHLIVQQTRSTLVCVHAPTSRPDRQQSRRLQELLV